MHNPQILILEKALSAKQVCISVAAYSQDSVTDHTLIAVCHIVRTTNLLGVSFAEDFSSGLGVFGTINLRGE